VPARWSASSRKERRPSRACRYRRLRPGPLAPALRRLETAQMRPPTRPIFPKSSSSLLPNLLKYEPPQAIPSCLDRKVHSAENGDISSKGADMDLLLKDKVAVVTGGNRGIGKACARQLAREGVDVALVARDRAALDASAAELAKESGRRVLGFVADTG